MDNTPIPLRCKKLRNSIIVRTTLLSGRGTSTLPRQWKRTVFTVCFVTTLFKGQGGWLRARGHPKPSRAFLEKWRGPGPALPGASVARSLVVAACLKTVLPVLAVERYVRL